jgi:hypothetical protein
MVQAMEWDSFLVIYEEGEGLIRLQEVLKMAPPKNKELRIKMRQLIAGPGRDYRQVNTILSHYIYTLNINSSLNFILFTNTCNFAYESHYNSVYNFLHKVVYNLMFNRFLSARKADLKKGFQHLVVVVLVVLFVVLVVGTRVKKGF